MLWCEVKDLFEHGGFIDFGDLYEMLVFRLLPVACVGWVGFVFGEGVVHDMEMVLSKELFWMIVFDLYLFW